VDQKGWLVMKAIHFRSLGITVTAVLALTGSTAAQERPQGLLNTLEVRTLVARGEPVDNDRLFVHFRALSERYESDAERHESFARSFVGNPNRSSGGGVSERCRRLAELNRQSAKTVRALALYHKKIADGAPATLPHGGARFQGGAGAPEPTEQELDALAARARSRTDHLSLAEYLRALARRYDTDASEHITMALTYRGGRLAQAAVHHDRLATVARAAAKEAAAAAYLHEQLSTVDR
jgi:hypothetical protein